MTYCPLTINSLNHQDLRSQRHNTHRTSYSPGRLDWHFRWALSRQGCQLESGWWTWSQTDWRHQLIAAKRSRSVYYLEGTGQRGCCCLRKTHQERFKWRLYFASEEVIPVYMPEKWVGLWKIRAAAGASYFMTITKLSEKHSHCSVSVY